ncbi:MAG: Ig-like domain-containing protein [Bradymonadia bacterium]
MSDTGLFDEGVPQRADLDGGVNIDLDAGPPPPWVIRAQLPEGSPSMELVAFCADFEPLTAPFDAEGQVALELPGGHSYSLYLFNEDSFVSALMFPISVETTALSPRLVLPLDARAGLGSSSRDPAAPRSGLGSSSRVFGMQIDALDGDGVPLELGGLTPNGAICNTENNPNEMIDSDLDGIPNSEDADADGDGIDDSLEVEEQTLPPDSDALPFFPHQICPLPMQMGVTQSITPEVEFTHPLSKESILRGDIQLFDLERQVQIPTRIQLLDDGRHARLWPQTSLRHEGRYALLLDEALEDTRGRPLGRTLLSTFQIEGEFPVAEADAESLRPVSISPQHEQTGVALDVVITIRFNQPVPDEGVEDHLQLLDPDGEPVPGRAEFAHEGLELRWTPTERLAPATQYSFALRPPLQSLGGLELEDIVLFRFTTEEGAPTEVIDQPVDSDGDGEPDTPLCTPTPERCDNVDNDCDARVDEGFGLGAACEAGQGECLSFGVVACTPEGESACDATPGVPSEEVCNGLDDDCNGLTDDELPGLDEECVADAAGVCAQGRTRCEGAQGMVCVPQLSPGELEETCNGEDDDCDSFTDERLVQTCYGGPEGTAGVGRCLAGVSTCASGEWGGCEGEVKPGPEACNAIDDDCDGHTDEDFPQLGESCAVGVGGCLNPDGIFICNPDGGAQCEGAPGDPSEEQCNNIDDDCDGNTDEGLSRTCGADTGLCQTGLETCNAGDWGECEGAVTPSPELCDGVDNDCDGHTDEEFLELGQHCSVGTGACTTESVWTCDDTGTGLTCDVAPAQATEEVCDDIDNDCDGNTDETLTRPCGSTVGACTEGTETCDAGEWGLCQGATDPTEEACDGVDNDCDGEIDEGAVCGTYAATHCRVWMGHADERPDLNDQVLPDFGDCMGAEQDVEGHVRCTSTRNDSLFRTLNLESGLGASDNFTVAFTCADDETPEVAAWMQSHCALYLGHADNNIGAPLDGADAWGPCPESLSGDADGLRCTSSGFDGQFRPIRLSGYVDEQDDFAVAFICRDDDTPSRARNTASAVEIILGWETEGDDVVHDGLAVWGDCPASPQDNDGLTRCVSTAGDQRFHTLRVESGSEDRNEMGIALRPLGAPIVGPVVPGPGACDPGGVEACNGEDDDCDGIVDEGYPQLGDACSAGVGTCAAEGTLVCNPTGDGILCDVTPGEPGEEVCNGLDDDCDGGTDESLSRSCFSGPEGSDGQGPCVAGLEVCSDGAWGACEGEVLPQNERCDFTDNDCDGFVDEDYPQLGQQCSEGVGACVSVGDWSCHVDGDLYCDAPLIAPGEEVCNAIDDDCDGQVDEGATCGDYIAEHCRVWLGQAEQLALGNNPRDSFGDCMAEPFDTTGNDRCTSTRGDSLFRTMGITGGLGFMAEMGVAFTCEDPTNPPLAAYFQARCAVFLGHGDNNLADGKDGDPDWGPCPESLSGEAEDLRCTSSGFDGRFRPMSLVGGVDENDDFGVAFVCADFIQPERAAGAAGAVEVILGWEENGPGTLRDGQPTWGNCPENFFGDVSEGTQCVSTAGDQHFHLLSLTAVANDTREFGIALRAIGAPLAGSDNPGCDPNDPDLCNGLDDDCDGNTDEDFAAQLGDPCDAGVGACRVEGAYICDPEDATQVICNVSPEGATEEVCDLEDNDCDGNVDEHLDQTCGSDVGACVSGVSSCVNGARTACIGEVVPRPEACDNIDTDCDGNVDEDVPTQQCDNSVGACESIGTVHCVAGVLECDAPVVEPQNESCNGQDDDCDGNTDEGFTDWLGLPCTQGIGACMREGTYVCSPDGNDVLCGAVPGDPSEEVCNELDDDCDGPVDEDIESQPCTNGDPHCPTQGMTYCELGNTLCDAPPPEINEEMCNGADDDCDGVVDEGSTCCSPTWGNCDGRLDTGLNGCETSYLNDANHCGGCDIKCGALQQCSLGECVAE